MAHTHVVAQGETLLTVAHHYGFRDWHAVYDHPDNAALKSSRPNPDVLNPGDQIFIPDKDPIERDCVTDQRHRFKLKSLRALFRLRIQNHFDVPLRNAKYRLEVEGRTINSRLENGELKCEVLPTTRLANLTVWPDDADAENTLQWTIQLGHLDTTATTRGIKGRLNNLGFSCTVDDADLDDQARDALRAFQASVGLPATGEADAETINRLEAKHVS